LGTDEDLIRNDEERYCLKQVYKICYYISKLYNYEILRMKCDFVKDYHGTIWFQYATNIWIRPSMFAMRESEDKAKRIKKINDDHRDNLMAQLEKFKSDS